MRSKKIWPILKTLWRRQQAQAIKEIPRKSNDGILRSAEQTNNLIHVNVIAD